MSAGCRHSSQSATAKRTTLAAIAPSPTRGMPGGSWNSKSSATMPAAIIAAAESV